MADLAVKVKFSNHRFDLLRAIARYTFPIWGVLLPVSSAIVVLVLIMMLLNCGVGGLTLTNLIPPLSFLGVCLFISTSGLLLHAISVPGSIILSKSGMRLPYLHGQPDVSNKNIEWSDITFIDVYDVPGGQEKVIAFFVDSKEAIKISLSEIEEKDLEPFFTAIELWAGTDKFKDKLLECKNSLAFSSTFTAMWEEELARRFMPTAFVPLPPGRFLRKGAIEVLRQLALGGLSAIYLCKESGCEIVVKEAVLPGDLEDEKKKKAKEMFEREAILLAKLDHPGIVKVRDYFIEDARHYLVLDYLNGQDLRQLVLQNGARSESQVIQMAEQVCAVMKYLHAQEPCILHRDLTPDNMVMTNDGSVVIIDFGAANEFLGTATGTLVGKQSYISPEQFRGKACIQSDIYSFGCTLHFLLTGKDPEPLSVSHPKEVNENISDLLDELVARCTDLEVPNRFASFGEIAFELSHSASLSIGES